MASRYYQLKSTGPLDFDGMQCRFSTSDGEGCIAFVYPVMGALDTVSVVFDNTTTGIVTLTDKYARVEIDLHDPYIALRLLRRLVACGRADMIPHTVSELCSRLVLDDENAKDHRAHSLSLLLSVLDQTDDSDEE